MSSLDRDANEYCPIPMQLFKDAQVRGADLRKLIADGKYNFGSMDSDEVKVTAINGRVYVPPEL